MAMKFLSDAQSRGRIADIGRFVTTVTITNESRKLTKVYLSGGVAFRLLHRKQFVVVFWGRPTNTTVISTFLS